MDILTGLEDVQDALLAFPGRFPRSELAAGRVLYYRSIGSGGDTDRSFLVSEKGDPVAVLVNGTKHGGFGYFDFPAHLEFARDGNSAGPTPLALRAIGKYLFDALELKVENVISYRKQSTNIDGLDSPLLKLGASPASLYQVTIDLEEDLTSILAGFNSGHRQRVKQGAELMGEPNFFYQDISYTTFQAFQALHLRVSGRSTRPKASWDLMNSAILEGKAILATIEINNEIIGGAFCWLSESAAEYGTGVYDRAYFSKFPVSHNLIYRSIEFAKNLGRKLFIIGNAYEPGGTEKERNIAQFKRGFGGSIETLSVYEFPTIQKRK